MSMWHTTTLSFSSLIRRYIIHLGTHGLNFIVIIRSHLCHSYETSLCAVQASFFRVPFVKWGNRHGLLPSLQLLPTPTSKQPIRILDSAGEVSRHEDCIMSAVVLDLSSFHLTNLRWEGACARRLDTY